MAICNALTGNIYKSCDNNTGGVTEIYIADYDNVEVITASGTPEEITAITMAATTFFYKFDINRNTSSIEETATIDISAGSTYFSQTVNLMLKRRTAEKRDAIKKLTDGQKKLRVIVKDSNGIYWLVGQEEGAYTTEVGGGSGIQKGDSNGYDVVINAEENAPMLSVDPTIIAALLAP